MSNKNMCKQVRFNLEKNRFHLMCVYLVPARMARQGYQLEFANRLHFLRRIENVGCILSKVLQMDHRRKIYETRFKNV